MYHGHYSNGASCEAPRVLVCIVVFPFLCVMCVHVRGESRICDGGGGVRGVRGESRICDGGGGVSV